MNKNQIPVAVSLMGKECYPQPIPGRYLLLGKLVLWEAKRKYLKNPNERYTIWYGRLLSYANRFEEAFAVYDDGIKRFPDSFRLYRHRGHRHISTYQLDKAVCDFNKAAELVEGKPLEWETDGIRCRLPIPPERTQWQIFYHQNVAKYLVGDYQGALSAAERCMEYNENDDDLIATTCWIHTNLLRLGRNEEAQKIMDNLPSGLKAKESKMYYNRLLVYKGELKPEALLEPVAGVSAYESQITDVTLRYGMALYYNLKGDKDRAQVLYKNLLKESRQWSAFAHIAAEVDLLALEKLNLKKENG
ncbi:hypothetical protein KJ966_19715 [bacterium]|nr:hypothetical protein [bacterium]